VAWLGSIVGGRKWSVGVDCDRRGEVKGRERLMNEGRGLCESRRKGVVEV